LHIILDYNRDICASQYFFVELFNVFNIGLASVSLQGLPIILLIFILSQSDCVILLPEAQILVVFEE
jgi:hypothetical protein